MMVVDRANKDKTKRLGSNYAVDLFGFEIILDLFLFFFFSSLWPDL